MIIDGQYRPWIFIFKLAHEGLNYVYKVLFKNYYECLSF